MSKTVSLNGEEVPRFVSGQQAGYNPESGKWHDVKGRFTTRDKALREPREWGRYLNVPSRTPASDLAEQFETIVAGMDIQSLRAAEKTTDPMPGAILAMMRLAEFYCDTEGDIFQTIETPLDIALKPLEIQSTDKAWQRDLETLYSEAHIDLFQNLYYIWLCSGIYGQAFPLEVFGSDPEDTRIVLIPPKNVEVGRSFSLGGSLSVRSPGRAGWTDQLLETAFPPMVYNRYHVDWNEQVAQGTDIVIPQDDCFPVREKSLPFQRYALPPIYRASRAISTRRIFEEMRRATVEGVKNQLWYFRYGDPKGENMPLPDEIQFLAEQIEGMYGERTGMLVWEGRLAIEVISPEAPDRLMANETYVGLTMECFRKLGISLKVVSGEQGPIGGSSKAGDMELDISVLLERVKFKVQQMYRWESRFRSRLAESMGPQAVKANKDTTVHFGKIGLEVERQLRERLLPAYQAGPLSAQTFLQEGGWDWQVELQRKKEESGLREMLAPPASFAQMVVGPAGEVKKEVSQTAPKGKPANKQDPRPDPKGSYFQGAADFDEYVNAAYAAYEKLEDVDTFIATLKEINRKYMYDFARDGYESVGGAFEVDKDWVDGAVTFVNSFADDFGERIKAASDRDALAWNVYLYPQEGRHLAYMYGVQQAMREKGARGWRRVLHPERSKTGPCDSCVADSAVMHSIEEPFFEFHPNGVCSAQAVAFYTSPASIPIEIPVPTKIFDPTHILQVLRELGQSISRQIQHIVRRVRGE